MRSVRVVAAGLCAALAGCVLFVDTPSSFGTSCRFNGDTTTTCGKCIATSCRTRVDACCGDGSCRALLDPLDRCAGGGSTAGCNALQTTSTSGASSTALQDCVRSACASVCAGSATADGGKPNPLPTGGGGTSCNTLGSGDSCSCVTSDFVQSNTTECSAASLGNAVCCTDSASSSLITCNCNKISCRSISSSSGDCQCQATSLTAELASCSGAHCCLHASTQSCYCQSKACTTGDQDVGTSCTADVFGCTGSRAKVDSCSR